MSKRKSDALNRPCIWHVFLFRHYYLPVAGHERVSASEQARFWVLREAVFWISRFIAKLQSVCWAFNTVQVLGILQSALLREDPRAVRLDEESEHTGFLEKF